MWPSQAGKKRELTLVNVAGVGRHWNRGRHQRKRSEKYANDSHAPHSNVSEPRGTVSPVARRGPGGRDVGRVSTPLSLVLVLTVVVDGVKRVVTSFVVRGGTASAASNATGSASAAIAATG